MSAYEYYLRYVEDGHDDWLFQCAPGWVTARGWLKARGDTCSLRVN